MVDHVLKNAFSEHLFEYRTVERKKLLLSLSITVAVMVIEVIGGILTNSIALISDAGHMFTHAFAMGISLIAIKIACKPPCHHRTFGLYRAEILAAFINGLFLILVVSVILYKATIRMLNPRDVLGLQMLMIALLGLAVNLISIGILRGATGDLNVRSVFYHLLGDAASSVGIVIAAAIIYFTTWNILDPLVSIGISALILYWAWGILTESGRILLEIAPAGLNVDHIANDLTTQFPEIAELFNLHLWAITPEMLVFSAHLRVKPATDPAELPNLLARINAYLAERYHIIESTIQIARENNEVYTITQR
ncbi:MAG TPA: cation transporter [Methanomicrobia archaeon]|nr:cation transporter [Methanomicrobia archaeon]